MSTAMTKEAATNQPGPPLGTEAGPMLRLVSMSSDAAEAPVIRMRGITKIYRMGDTELYALRDIDLDIRRREFVGLMGPSGSGKSTLMNIIGCLDQPTSGTYELDGIETSTLSD